jgi:hypothetical protein
MSTMSFSPAEEGVLSLIGEELLEMEDLHELLCPEIPADQVTAAVGLLKWEGLLANYGTSDYPFYYRTEKGTLVLAEYRRGQRDRYQQGVLHAV